MAASRALSALASSPHAVKTVEERSPVPVSASARAARLRRLGETLITIHPGR
jgi:hypothetical protein